MIEGGVFLDIFAENSEAYVCTEPEHSAGIPARTERKKVCTHVAPDGSGLTRCQLLSVGVCSEAAPRDPKGNIRPETIHVWLDRADPD